MNWVDVLSVIAWGSCASVGLVVGFMRVWVPLAFLLAGMGFAGGLGPLVGPGIFGFIDSESGQTVAGFFLVFGLFMLLGAVVSRVLWKPMGVMSALMSLLPVGAVFNRFGGLLAGTLFGCVFLSLVFMGLQQYPVNSVGRAMGESSFAAKPVGWVDRYVATLEFSTDWEDFDE